MPCYVIFASVLLVTLVTGSVIEDTIVIARCRASCADKFVALSEDTHALNEQCFQQESCLECWETCAEFVNSPETYAWMCQEEQKGAVCSMGVMITNCNYWLRKQNCIQRAGCQTSCLFVSSLQDKNGDAEESYPMTGHVSITNDTHLLVRGHVTLPEVEGEGEGHYGAHVVYALLYSVRAEWKLYGMSMYAEFGVHGAHRDAPNLRFLVLAVTARELIAWTDPTIPRTSTPESTTTPTPTEAFEYYDYYYYYEPTDAEDGRRVMPINLDYDDEITTTTSTTSTAATTTIPTVYTTTITAVTKATSVEESEVEEEEGKVVDTKSGDLPPWEDLWQLIEPRLGEDRALPPINDVPSVSSSSPSDVLFTNDVLLLILALSSLLILAVFAMATCMLCNNLRMRREMMRMNEQEDVEKGGSGNGSRWSKESSTKPMAPWQPKQRMITVDPKTMEALQLPLLHSTPRKGAAPSKLITSCDPESTPNKGIHLTVPRSPSFVHSAAADIPRIQIQREMEVGEMELDKSDSFDTGMDPDFYSRL